MTGPTVLSLGMSAGMDRADVLTQMQTIVVRWHQHHGGSFPGWDAVTEAMPTDPVSLARLYGQDAVRLASVLSRTRSQ